MQKTNTGLDRMVDPVDLNPSRWDVLFWVFGWKVLDWFSTLTLAERYGWSGELNVFHLSGVAHGSQIVVWTIPVTAVMVFVLYDRVNWLVESFCLVLPLVVLTNLVQVVSPVLGVLQFVWIPLVVTGYWLNGWSLFFLDGRFETQFDQRLRKKFRKKVYGEGGGRDPA